MDLPPRQYDIFLLSFAQVSSNVGRTDRSFFPIGRLRSFNAHLQKLKLTLSESESRSLTRIECHWFAGYGCQLVQILCKTIYTIRVLVSERWKRLTCKRCSTDRVASSLFNLVDINYSQMLSISDLINCHWEHLNFPYCIDIGKTWNFRARRC